MKRKKGIRFKLNERRRKPKRSDVGKHASTRRKKETTEISPVFSSAQMSRASRASPLQAAPRRARETTRDVDKKSNSGREKNRFSIRDARDRLRNREGFTTAESADKRRQDDRKRGRRR